MKIVALPSLGGAVIRFLGACVLTGLLATTTALAQGSAEPANPSESAPTEESVRRLLEVTQVKKVLQTASEQMDATFDAMVKKQLGDTSYLTPEQQHAIEARRKAAKDMVKKLLNWESMQAMYLKVYRETFTQAEIDGMLKFYATPAGQALIAKLPLVVKNTMIEVRLRLEQMMPKLQQMAREAAEDARAQGSAKNGS